MMAIMILREHFLMDYLNQKNLRLIAKLSGKTEQELKKMLYNAGYSSVPIAEYKSIYDVGGILTDPTSISLDRILQNSYMEVENTFRMIQTKAIESAKQTYIDIINKSYLEVSSGIYDYNT